MRYINKQQHFSSCGPVAVINAMKWLGRKLSYCESIGTFEKLGFSYSYGMFFNSLSRSLNYFDIKYERINSPTWLDVKEAVDDGHSVIINYKWYSKKDNNWCGHYTFLDGYTDKRLKIYNGHWYDKDKLKNNLLNSIYCHCKSAVWIIKR